MPVDFFFKKKDFNYSSSSFLPFTFPSHSPSIVYSNDLRRRAIVLYSVMGMEAETVTALLDISQLARRLLETCHQRGTEIQSRRQNTFRQTLAGTHQGISMLLIEGKLVIYCRHFPWRQLLKSEFVWLLHLRMLTDSLFRPGP
jgi:hypothetical protein